VKLCNALILFFIVSLTGAETAVCAEAVSAATVTAVPGTREAVGTGETTEKHLPKDTTFTPWLLDPSVFAEDQGDRTEKRQIAEKDVKTIKLQNLVPPIHFASGEAEIPVGYVQRLRDVLDNMQGRSNVRLHFVGHTDNAQLFGEVKQKYGDNLTLSKERAGVTAEYFQKTLHLPSESITYEGMGESRPLASNATE